MAELNLKQITEKLNKEFTGNNRKLIFWYDDNADFAEDIDTLELQNAKIYHLKKDNQFYTKYFLECEDTTTNYLIYAPFPKPDIKDNHLEDTLLYSKRFLADRASLIVLDLKIEEQFKDVIKKYIKFFASKERTKRFYDLEISVYNQDSIETGLLCALCRARVCSFEEVIRIIFTEFDLNDNKWLTEIEKYNLTEAFWRLCYQYFGYKDANPSLEKFLMTMFATYTYRYMQADVPKDWKDYISDKAGNVIAFLDNTMNNRLYKGAYDKLSAYIETKYNVSTTLANYPPEALLECDTFLCIDQLILKWLTERLLAEDTGAMLNNFNITQICDKRSKMHFGEMTKNIYNLLDSSYHLLLSANYKCQNSFTEIWNAYQSNDWQIDYHYRHFHFIYGIIMAEASVSISNDLANHLEQLKTLTENIYTNEYLNKQLPAWNNALQAEKAFAGIRLQRNFYKDYLDNSKERTVIIISDALRYEVAKELFIKMQDNPNCSAKITAMLSTLPSYTRLGMAALLPHKTLSLAEDFEVFADNQPCNNILNRQNILKSYCPNSICVQYDDIKNLKKNELREIFTGKEIIYVYHNQIDARGDKANTEDEVFNACAEAINEIADFIKRIYINANTYRFIITADHGFIYKANKLSESDKITANIDITSFINRRFIIANQAIKQEGVHNMRLGYVLNNDDKRVISYPISSNVFKVSGGGQNYVHGGSSPQEMLVPVIEIKMDRYHMDTKLASIAVVSILNKITNLITAIDFMQIDPVSDTVKAANYKIYFISKDNEKISNENIFIADKRDSDPQNRIQRMNFIFKSQKYDKTKPYYLVIVNAETNIETFRQSIIMDLAFSDDFGF